MKRLGLALSMVVVFPLSVLAGAVVGAAAFGAAHARVIADLFRSQ